MLDVIHFLLEEDVVTSTGEQSKARSEFREQIYRDLYRRTYRFDSRGRKDRTSDSIGGTGTSIVPDDGRMTSDAQGLTHKPYIPPTDMEIGPDPTKPFRGLEAPLG